MKRSMMIIVLVVLFSNSIAQKVSPIKWIISAEKSDNYYNIIFNVQIEEGWHLYSQIQPKNSIAQPTIFKFTKNPLINYESAIAEIGVKELYHDKKLDISAFQYSNQVKFIQHIKIIKKTKTAVSGWIEYQTCDNTKCLPPEKKQFSILL